MPEILTSIWLFFIMSKDGLNKNGNAVFFDQLHQKWFTDGTYWL